MILKQHHRQYHFALPSKRDDSGGLSSSAIGAIVGSIAAVVLVVLICAFCWSHAAHRRRDFDRRQRQHHIRQKIRTGQSSQRNSRTSLRQGSRRDRMSGPLPETQFSWKWRIQESGPPRTAGNPGYRKENLSGPFAARPYRTWERIPGGPKYPAYRAVPGDRMEKLPRMKRVFPAPARTKGMPQVNRTVGVVHGNYQPRMGLDEEEGYSEEGPYDEESGGLRSHKGSNRVYKPRR